MEKRTQTSTVLELLQNGKSITQLEATHKYGIIRLSGIIYELRKEYNIETNVKKIKNRYGSTSTIAEYKLVS